MEPLIDHRGPPLLRGACDRSSRVALRDGAGDHTYEELLRGACRVGARLLAGTSDLAEARVAYLLEPSFENVAVMWGIWVAGGLAIPLALSHPRAELDYVLDDARPAVVVTSASLRERVERGCAQRGIPLLGTEALLDPGAVAAVFPPVERTRRALMIYTSGTTGKPKGAVSTHGNLDAQVATLLEAWGWSADDRALHVLPLHHVHGLVNVLCCALAGGARCEFSAPFDAERVWDRLASGDITVFMAVPTIYRRLILAWEAADQGRRGVWSAGVRGLRLMVSGSAALPVATLERWERITGHRLLERYGMTEIGMALSNPLAGERRAGTVGQPLPGVEARIVDEHGNPVPAGGAGQIQVRGPQVFLEYWGRTEETADVFRGGWFLTGDEADVVDGYWRILGRRSVDILKTGGYKVSALEIEEALREHDDIADAAVVGVADPEWGERVCAAVVAAANSELTPERLRAWCKERLAPYKVPRDIEVVDELPRNAMGKVMKPQLQRRFGG